MSNFTISTRFILLEQNSSEGFILGYYFCLNRDNNGAVVNQSKEFWNKIINLDDLIANKLIDEN